jgi:starch-binding outer membrane protein, SusD/RagB family
MSLRHNKQALILNTLFYLYKPPSIEGRIRIRVPFITSIIFLLLIFFQTSCKKLVEVDTPPTSEAGATVFNNDASASSVLTGIYTSMSLSSFPSGGITSMSLFPGLSADELSVFGNYNPTYTNYYTNALTNSNTGGSDFWTNIYQTIFIVNSAIQGLSGSTSLTPAVKQQLLGEAYFMRSFCYFYLVNLYDEVPLVVGTDYTVNYILARTSKAQVWSQIVSDLKNAQSQLSPNYLDATLLNTTTERVRPTLWAAYALLSRTYLYQQKWDSAITQATEVINNGSLYSLDTLNGVFLANSNEAVWQLQPVIAGENTQDALLFILPASGPSFAFPVYLDTILVNAFEQGDQRKQDWIDSANVGGTIYYYANKYKINVSGSPVSEYEMVLRLGEQYLIRAEAEAEMNNLTQAVSDLNLIRIRASLPPISNTISQTELLRAIYHERQVELFTEWGHRWLDLKRTNSIDSVMGSPGNVCKKKGGEWNSYQQLYPIPLSELQRDPNLTQNIGY